MGFMISNKVFQQHFSTVNISWTKNFFEKSADLGMKKTSFVCRDKVQGM